MKGDVIMSQTVNVNFKLDPEVKKRMEKAAELLENTNLKVIEIANSVGYENQGKFGTVFKKMYGVTPLEYRRQNLNSTYGSDG